MNLTGSKAKMLYQIAEKIRYESLGTQEYKGIKDNLINYYKKQKPLKTKQKISTLHLKII